MIRQVARTCGAIGLAVLAACGSTSDPTARSGATTAASRKTPALVMPIERDGHYVLEFGNLLFDVVPAGGKIMGFSIDGYNMLVATHPINFGSTLWASPQSDWNWPPQKPIDSEPYAVEVKGNTITMTSGVTTTVPKIRVIKKFTPDLARGAIDIEYTIRNEDTVTRSLAVWEVTRVAAGGLTFFPIVGTTNRPGSRMTPTVIADGFAWMDMAVNPPRNPKLNADGVGYIAHTDGTRLFVKSWDDVPADAQAPGEGEVEFYDGDTNVELENQGRYGPVAPGQSTTYKVRWSLVNLPAGTARAAQNSKLIEAATALATPPR
jgi:hypothetical protein